MREILVVSEWPSVRVADRRGLVDQSFQQLLDVDLGFQPENAAAWRIDPNRPFPDRAARTSYFEQLVRQIEAAPGVEAVGLTDTLPLGRNRNWTVTAKGETYPPGELPFAFPRIIDARYIRAMRIPLRAGRDLDVRDGPASERVMLVNEAMARQLWRGREAVGQLAMIGDAECRVVGVVGNVRHSALEREGAPEIYLPMPQWNVSSLELVVRTKLPVESLVPTVRTALKQIDPNLPSSDFQTLGQLIDRAVSPRRFIVVLLGGFSLLALILSALGIYGVISYTVSQRTHEIGIRLAIGSPAAAVLRLIVGEGLKLALVGVGIGLFASLAMTRIMKALLFGVSATDPALTAVPFLQYGRFRGLLAARAPRRGDRSVEALRCE
jgi:predicted permease